MPLFMDFHKFEGITVEDVKNAHIADLAVQDKYGVKYHQFWVNQQAGTVFCLMEGPDQASCEAVHREAHGNAACAMVEVEPGFYELFMGSAHLLDHGHVRHADGAEDLGFRNVMVITLQRIASQASANNNKPIQSPDNARKLIMQKVTAFNGRKIEHAGDDSLVAVFDSSFNALHVAREVQDLATSFPLTCKIGISAGQPVTKDQVFFEDAVRLAYRLSVIAPENHIVISSLASELISADEIRDLTRNNHIRSLSAHDETFVTSLLGIVDNRLADDSFTIESLGRDLGVSRPQLYRKIVTLTGRSPNDLIRDLRMTRAINLLKRRCMNIAQIALEVGYCNPSYFTKCFAEKFGCTPSTFIEAAV